MGSVGQDAVVSPAGGRAAAPLMGSGLGLGLAALGCFCALLWEEVQITSFKKKLLVDVREHQGRKRLILELVVQESLAVPPWTRPGV